jgi:hypothetical protein
MMMCGGNHGYHLHGLAINWPVIFSSRTELLSLKGLKTRSSGCQERGGILPCLFNQHLIYSY